MAGEIASGVTKQMEGKTDGGKVDWMRLRKRPRGLWNYLMDFGLWKVLWKQGGCARVIEICSTDMLEFSLSVLGVDVFMGLSLEGVTAEWEKSKIKTEENGLKEGER